MKGHLHLALLAAVAALAASTEARAQAEDLDDVEPAVLAPGKDPAEEPAAPAKSEPGASEPGAGAGRAASASSQASGEANVGSGELTFGGRVFARATAFDTDDVPWTGGLELASVRLGARYRWKKKLRAKVVLEASGKVSVRDALLELDGPRGLELSIGRFKGPVSAIERASAWILPSIDRGAVAEILEDGLALTGRRDGVELRWQRKKRGPAVLATVSQSVATTGDAAARPLSEGAGLAAALRGELSLGRRARIGAVVSNREVNYVSDVGRYWAAGLDAEIDLGERLGLRAWIDVLAGQSHLGATSADAPTTFFASQAIAGKTFGGATRGAFYLEPYVLAAYLNPDVEHRLDHVLDTSVGLAGGRWQRWRLQLQGSRVATWSRRPAGLLGFGADLNDKLAVSLQLGAAF